MNLSRRDFIGLSAGAFAIGLAGCTGEPTVQKEPQAATEASTKSKEQDKPTLEVVDSGFYADKYNHIHFAAKITNSSTEYAAANVAVTITAKNVDGKILNTSRDLLSAIYPDGDAYIGGMMSVSDEVKTLEFSIADKKEMWQKVNQKQSDYVKTFYAENINFISDNTPSVTGEAISKSKYDFQQSKVIIVFTDNSGKIVGGECASIEDLSAGAKQPFSITVFGKPEYKNITAYVDAGYIKK